MQTAMNFIKTSAIASALLGLLVGCLHPTEGDFTKNVQNMHASLIANAETQKAVQKQSKALVLPSAVTAQMLPAAIILPGEQPSAAAARFDVTVHEVEVKAFFSGLAAGADCSIVVAPEVTGNITVNLKQVTLAEVLEAVTNLYGYRYEKTDYGYTIYPRELETRIFMVNKLALERTLATNTQLNTSGGDLTNSGGTSSSSAGSSSSGNALSTVTLQASQKESFWTNIQTTISALIQAQNNATDGPLVEVTQETGMVVVRAYPKDLQTVEAYLMQTQRILGREVVIEAEILDVELSNEYSAGIDWSVLSAGGTSSGATPSNLLGSSSNPGISLIGNVYSLSLSGDHNNFTYAVNLLANQGRVSVLSKPRVSAINNQSAIIKVGTDNYYVTSVQSQVTSGSSSGDSTTSTINLQAFFSGISLYITPQITAEGEVNLHIHPAVSRVSENNLQVTVAGQSSTLPVASSVLRETDTVVRAKNGQVIILGGLIQEDISDLSSGLPVNQKYAQHLGPLVTARQKEGAKTELVILLRPLMVEDEGMRKDLTKTAQKLFTEKSMQEFFSDAYRN